jgi:hypothetical protein
MFGRTLKLAAVLVLTQIGSGCCWCYRPFFCHGFCGGCASTPCSSCYSPAAAPSAQVIAPLPAVSVTPSIGAPIIPPATSSAGNPTVEKVPYSSATYTHPIR